MRNLFLKRIFVLGAALVLPMIFVLGCSSDGGSSSDGGDGYVSSVSLTPASTAIDADGSTSLKATATISGSPKLTYKWEITEGSDYASISGTGAQVTLNGTNSTSSQQTVKVRVSVSDGTNTKNSNVVSITVRAASQTETKSLTSVKISGTTEIEATGTGELIATATSTGSPDIDYTWTIVKEDGTAKNSSSYMKISGNGAKATVTGTSTDSSSAHTVTVQVTAKYDTSEVADTYEITVQKVGVTVENKLTALSLSASATSLAPDGSVTLTPQLTYTGTISESDCTVSDWKITAGSDYAELLVPSTNASRGLLTLTGDNTSILQAKNTTTSSQTVTASVTVAVGSVTKTAECSVTVGAAKVTGVTISGTTSIDATGTTELTADVEKTGNPANVTYSWEITSGEDYAEITSGADSEKVIITGKNTKASAKSVIVKVTVSDRTNNVTSTQTVTVAKNPNAVTSLLPTFPANGEENAYADTQLVINFTSTPTLVSGKSVKIYTSTGTLVDTINILPTSDDTQSTQSGYSINTGNQQLVRVSGNSVYIQPHYNGSSSATVLSASTSYYVEIPAAAITTSGTLKDGTAWNGFSGTSGWTFTTKAAPAISTSSAITVSNDTSSTDADFFSVYGALCAAATKSSGTYEIDIAATEDPYYELISVQGKGAHIILKGQGTETYGSDVVIEYVNNVYMNNSTHTRPSFYFKGSGNLTFENVTLKNLTQRKTSYTADNSYTSNGSYQAEALYYACSSGYMNAYNSSFVSLQDTILTAGDKAWFYGCYVAGDVDFMWGTTSVALFENCAIECLNTSATSAYLFETRIGSTSGTSVGKGYVLLNSTVTVDSGVTAYYARRATGKSSTSYYDQAAIVNSTFSGSGSLAAARWYDENKPEYLSDTLYGTSADVGWKEYGVTNSTATSSTASTSVYGVITSTEYTNEYSGRHAILNRYYDITNACYAKDSSTNWDIDSLISDRSYSCTEDTSEETLDGESIVTTTTWDFSSSDFGSGITSYNGITLSGTGYDSKGYCTGSSGATITIPATGACSVTVYYCYAANGTISATGDTTDAAVNFSTASGSTGTIETATFNYTLSDTGNIVVATAGTTYITKITQSYTTNGDSGDSGDVEVFWKAGDYDDATLSENTTLGIMTVEATPSKTVSVSSATATIDEISFTKKLALGGSGSVGSYKTLKFSLSGTAAITVYAGKAGSAGRNLVLSDGSTTYGSQEMSTSANASYSYTYTGSGGTLYLYSSSNGIDIYGVKIVTGSLAVSSVTISGKTSVEVGSSITLTATPNVSTTSAYTWTVTNGTGSATGSSTTNTLTLTGGTAGTVTVTASVDGVTSAAYTVTVKEAGSTPTISLTDTPTGYAAVNYSNSSSYTTVSPTSASDLKTYLKSSTAYIIKLSGTYDLSEGYLPTVAGGSTDLLDALVKKVSITDDTSSAYTDYETYSAWKAGYASSCSSTTDDKSSDTTKLVWALNSEYQTIVKVNVGSNKIIIGDGTAVIKGGLLNISSKSNIIIRNVTIQDAYDPFPHHESGDGFNAELDCICIQGTSSYIWIDHCTLQDTLGYSYVTISDGKTKEKWQTFDGLCDIKNSVSNITVSYCKIAGHDKTMLIGNNDSDGNSSTRTITLHHNYFYNCGQRLPMVRNSTIHIYNNYYHKDSSATYSQQYAVGVRSGAIIYAENNYFSSGIGYSFKDSYGSLYSNGNEDKSSEGCNSTVTGTTLFSSAVNAYSYDVDSASDVPDIVTENAGAGAWSVTIN